MLDIFVFVADKFVFVDFFSFVNFKIKSCMKHRLSCKQIRKK